MCVLFGNLDKILLSQKAVTITSQVITNPSFYLYRTKQIKTYSYAGRAIISYCTCLLWLSVIGIYICIFHIEWNRIAIKPRQCLLQISMEKQKCDHRLHAHMWFAIDYPPQMIIHLSFWTLSTPVKALIAYFTKILSDI